MFSMRIGEQVINDKISLQIGQYLYGMISEARLGWDDITPKKFEKIKTLDLMNFTPSKK